MTRIGTLFWILLVSGSAGGMYAVKYRVQGIERALVKTEKATIAEQNQIRVLEAEWTYLNRPEALERMNTRFLSLVPVTAKELRTSAADLPMRPKPAPDDGTAPQGAKLADVAAAPSARPRLLPAVLKQTADRAAVRPLPGRRGKLMAQATPRSQTPRRNKSLDDLIARIVASR